jgi:glycosyltransferase involved in cell wall biosynthesis
MELLVREGVETILVKFSDVRHLPPLVRHLAYFWKVVRAARTADIVLVLDPVSTGLPAAIAATCTRTPYVVKIVGDYAWEQGTQRFGVKDSLDSFVTKKVVALPVMALRLVQTHVAKGARAVIVPSEYLKRIVMAWGVPEYKFSVIYNAMRSEALGAVPHEITTLPRPRIVTVGRLVPWKHIEGIIDAMAVVNQGSLIVVGEGPERTRLTTHAATVFPRTSFTGQLSHGEVLAVMQDADALVLNSSYEGMSHLLIEAVSLGVPSVATDVGGNREVIMSDADGQLVESGNKEMLVAGIRAALARKKRVHPESAVLKFAPITMVKSTVALLKSCL